MKQYEPVIGLEVHVELNTKTKMFCACSADYFGKKPNTSTCPVCLGLPGATPYTNAKAIEGCIKIGLALNCQINKESLFERKNYFYPDLAKGYQISQYRWPLCTGGDIEVEGADGTKKTIRINRAHQEEDTGKLTHRGAETLIDFNRSGVPLVEIVTEPDFTDTAQIRDYAKKLQAQVRSIGVSNADMERGDMRLEANVSVRPKGQKELPPYRVELKNINSFRFMVAATEFEIARQIKALEAGKNLHQETRGWNEAKKETYLQRTKEEANDYRYFPDPDLPILISQDVKKLQGEISGTLPETRKQNLMKDFALTEKMAAILIRKGNDEYFQQAAELGQAKGIDARGTATFIINNPSQVEKQSPQELVGTLASKSQNIIGDESQLGEIVQRAINQNDKAVADYKAGKEAALQVIMGAIMKETKGKADAKKVKEILEGLLKA